MTVELHFENVFLVSGFFWSIEMIISLNLHFIPISFCPLRKKEPNSCVSNTIEDRFQLIADFVESEFLYLKKYIFSDIALMWFKSSLLSVLC